jgi:hypothetical protein
VKIVFGPSLIAALAGALLMLNATLSSGSTDLFRRVARSGEHGFRVNQESRIQYLQPRTLRRRNPSSLPQEMTRRRFLLYDSQE